MEKYLERTSKHDQKIAMTSISRLKDASSKLLKSKTGEVRIKIQDSGEYITIPKKALSLLFSIISNMAEGKSISVIPSDTEVSTQQAAEMLGVSRPHLVRILEEGQLPFRKVGSHRRVELKDLIEFETKLKKIREEQLQFLADQAQDLSLGYK